MKPSEILDEVITLFQQGDTWGKRSFYFEGKYCLVGGLDKVSPSWAFVGRQVAVDHIRTAIHNLFPERGLFNGQIFHFNDHPDTTKDDVIRVLERAKVLATENRA